MSDVHHTWVRMRTLRDTVRDRWNRGNNYRTALVVGIIILPLFLMYLFAVRAPSTFPSESIVTVPEGSTLESVGEILIDGNYIRSELALRVGVMLYGDERGIIAGDYLFKRPMNVFTVAQRVSDGDFGLEPIRIRIPEGTTAAEMAPFFEDELPRFDTERFAELGADVEGYLFPDTYFFLPNATEETVIRALVSNFEIQIESLEEELAASEHSLDEIVIMASLLEKEASRYSDRRKIAGVLWRRLDIGMPLQVDAAFLYILGRTTFDLTLEDLQVDSPYNTYRYKGLPIGPIANPSLSSLRAALNPIDDGYLFYLADRSGVTHYSETYEEHLRKKSIYID